MRCHRFLKGEGALLIAAIGPRPLVAAAASGSAVDLPAVDPRRDGSGVALAQPVTMIAGRIGDQAAAAPAGRDDANGDGDSAVESLF